LSWPRAASLSRGGPFLVRPGSLRGRAAAALLLLVPVLSAILGWDGHVFAACDVPSGPLADSLRFGTEAAARSHVGILAVSLDRGDTLLGLNPEGRFIPASNMKLFVTGAFLKQFGPDARGLADIAAVGKLDRSKGRRELALKGDLILRGSGYPDVYQLLKPGSRGLLDSLAYLLYESGMRKFEGTVWVDGTLFAREPYGPGWAVDDLPWSYGAPLNSVLANGNAATLLATATPTGVVLSLDPPETPLKIEGRLSLVDSSSAPVLSISRDPGSRVLRVSGRVPRGGVAKRQVAVPEPDSTAGLVLLGAMRRAGIKVKGTVATMPANGRRPGSKDPVTLTSLSSPPASEVVSMVDAYSLNVETEALLRLLDPAPAGKTAAQGLRKLSSMLAEAGVDTLDLSFVDGSGLSPLNLATPRAFVRWLAYLGQDSTLSKVFRETLAVPGGVGTLQRRFPDLGPEASLRAKSGTLTNVSALSGYVTSAEGERIVFSILSNGNRGGVASARAAEEAIVGALSRYRRGAESGTAPGGATPRMIPR